MMRALRLAALSLCIVPAAFAQGAGNDAAPLLFRVVGPRDEVTIGLTPQEFEALGPEAGVARLAHRLVADGQLTAWLYSVGRAPDGTTRLVPNGRVAILRSDALRIEAYRAALPVGNPPSAR